MRASEHFPIPLLASGLRVGARLLLPVPEDLRIVKPGYVWCGFLLLVLGAVMLFAGQLPFWVTASCVTVALLGLLSGLTKRTQPRLIFTRKGLELRSRGVSVREYAAQELAPVRIQFDRNPGGLHKILLPDGQRFFLFRFPDVPLLPEMRALLLEWQAKGVEMGPATLDSLRF